MYFISTLETQTVCKSLLLSTCYVDLLLPLNLKIQRNLMKSVALLWQMMWFRSVVQIRPAAREGCDFAATPQAQRKWKSYNQQLNNCCIVTFSRYVVITPKFETRENHMKIDAFIYLCLILLSLPRLQINETPWKS